MSHRILIVDESAELRHLLKFPLLYAGFEVIEAQDAMEALGVLAYQNVALVVTDWEMPQMNGLEFALKVRQTPAWASLPIIMLLKENERHKRPDLQYVGITDTIIRPQELDRLVEKTRHILAQRI
ncbi:MAG: response regulator [Bacteroidetes bacterium]|nr:MAG: response regulator [Bacteroidota bacterium]